jgi:hypothetical protein
VPAVIVTYEDGCRQGWMPRDETGVQEPDIVPPVAAVMGAARIR